MLAPIRVHSARMPLAFGSFYAKLPRLDKKLTLASRTALAIREQVATINGCLFCMDAARWHATRQSPEEISRLDALGEHRASPLFTDAERAALDPIPVMLAAAASASRVVLARRAVRQCLGRQRQAISAGLV